MNRVRTQPIVGPQGENAQQASQIYEGTYGDMPIPATAFVLADTPLRSVDVEPSLAPVWKAPYVQRRNRRKGLFFTGGRQSYNTPTPQYNEPVYSSEFQEELVGPQVNYVINTKWYIDYPAATVMNGGKHNLAWSTRVAQLPTRTTGGPGPAAMLPAPRFKSVQTVPRYSTMPSTYPTASAQG